jgi:nucleoside-diphosphate kinase
MKERTLLIVRPPAVSQLGDMVKFLWAHEFNVTNIAFKNITREHMIGLYPGPTRCGVTRELVIEQMCSTPAAFCILEREDAIAYMRKILGHYLADEAEPGTFRATFKTKIGINSAHASDSHINFLREMAIFFPDVGEREALIHEG